MNDAPLLYAAHPALSIPPVLAEMSFQDMRHLFYSALKAGDVRLLFEAFGRLDHPYWATVERLRQRLRQRLRHSAHYYNQYQGTPEYEKLADFSRHQNVFVADVVTRVDLHGFPWQAPMASARAGMTNPRFRHVDWLVEFLSLFPEGGYGSDTYGDLLLRFVYHLDSSSSGAYDYLLRLLIAARNSWVNLFESATVLNFHARKNKFVLVLNGAPEQHVERIHAYAHDRFSYQLHRHTGALCSDNRVYLFNDCAKASYRHEPTVTGTVGTALLPAETFAECRRQIEAATTRRKLRLLLD